MHVLLTYTCLYECDHCFLYCSPRAEGVFTIGRLDDLLHQALAVEASSVYFEGGEPFLYYPLLLEGLRRARAVGLQTGVVSNCYWATTASDAEMWLTPIADVGVDDLSLSDDAFHSEDPEASPAKSAHHAAEKLGLPVGNICIEAPTVSPVSAKTADGAVVGGDVLFKGRAADKLVGDLPRRDASAFRECPHEELENPSRVHVDPFGNVFVCQGVSIGNVWKKPLDEIVATYQPDVHPIVGPLLKGGPQELARRYNVAVAEGYVDHCHLCFLVRRQLRSRMPFVLCPEQVYGVEP